MRTTTIPLCPVCRLPVNGGQDLDPFDDYCECGPEDAACWTCGSLDHADLDCPDLVVRPPTNPYGWDDDAYADDPPMPGEWADPMPAPADSGPLVEWWRPTERTVPVAVYGTLRRGHGNWRRFLADVRGPSITGWIDGSLFYVAGHGGYPVCVLGTGEATFVEVYDMPLAVFAAVANMETGAGYTIDVVGVGNESGNEPVPALAFGWPHRRHGAPVPGNDWSNA